MRVYWDDHQRWEVTVSRWGERIHVYLTAKKTSDEPGLGQSCEVYGLYRSDKRYCKPAQLEKRIARAQKLADKKNLAEHLANERVKLLAINEQNWVEAPSTRRRDVPVRDGGKSI